MDLQLVKLMQICESMGVNEYTKNSLCHNQVDYLGVQLKPTIRCEHHD